MSQRTLLEIWSMFFFSFKDEAERAIDPWPLREKGLTVLVLPNQSDRKGNNNVSKCNLTKYLFRIKTKESVTYANFTTRGQFPIVLSQCSQSKC